jgi:hypothetical protein
MQDKQLQDNRVYKRRDSPLPPFIKCNVLRESLSVDSQNIYCATEKRRRGSWVISIYLWVGCMCNYKSIYVTLQVQFILGPQLSNSGSTYTRHP